MSENRILISATTSEDWQKLKDSLSKLPQKTIERIEKVESSFAIICYFKKIYGEHPQLFIPRELVTQIHDFGDYIGIYCGDFFFKAPKSDYHYEYIFVESPKNNINESTPTP